MCFLFPSVADTKNSAGIVGCIEEVAHNAIAVYWNPLESSAKVSICLEINGHESLQLRLVPQRSAVDLMTTTTTEGKGGI